MKLVFVSNFLNHHQIFLCEDLRQLCSEFTFISTEKTSNGSFQIPIENEYVIQWIQSPKEAEQRILDADVAIFGSCPNRLKALRMKENKLSFLFSERFLKKGLWRRFIFTTRKKINEGIVAYKDDKMYVLCASAYLPYELSLFHFPLDKCFRWGYFPEMKQHNLETLLADKSRQEKVSMVWAGRFLAWKHPEMSIILAEFLKEKGYKFQIDIIGNGEMEQKLQEMIRDKKLESYVKILGSMSPVQVRAHMEKANIFLFTSDYKEGWGAVLNEAMNSGCAVVANHAAGSVPFLLENGRNGLIYENGKQQQLFEKVKYLLDNPEEQVKMGRMAYNTIASEWNHKVAADRLIGLSKYLLEENRLTDDLYQEGPCSRTGILKNRWFKG